MSSARRRRGIAITDVLWRHRTVAITTTTAAPAGRRMLKQYSTNFTRTFTTNKDTAGNFKTFTQVQVYGFCQQSERTA